MTAALRPLALSPRDAAPVLGVSRETVRRLCLTGQLRHRKVGRRTLIPYSALEEFIEGGPVLPGSTVEAGHGPDENPSRVVVAQTGPGFSPLAPAESAPAGSAPAGATPSQPLGAVTPAGR